MTVLRESFIALQCFGLWPSPQWQSGSLKVRAYYIHSILVLTMIHWFTLSELFSLLTTSAEDFANNCFMMLTMMAVCVKALLILRHKSEISDVLVALESHPHAPVDYEEEIIQNNFNRQIRSFTLLYAGLVECTVWTMSISTFFQGIPYGVLPFKAWLPYHYSTPLVYWLNYCGQLLSVVIGANINIGFDTGIPGFFMQICAKFNLLKYRLQKAIDDIAGETETSDEVLKKEHEQQIFNCIKYHRAIFEISKKIDSIFATIIFIQYAASSIIICASVYLISQCPLFSPEFTCLFLYLSCMLVQIFMLCASGNEATIESESSTSSIYNSNWYTLKPQTRKYLVTIMLRTQKPLIFKSGFIIAMSLNSFRTLLKSSYTAYTVLQQSSQ